MVSILLTLCPPGPLLLNTSILKSFSSIFISTSSASGKTATFTTGYNFHGKGPVDLGEGGTTAGTNYYGLYIETGSVATNNYGVWINDDAYTNKLGGVTLAGGTISTDGISIVDNEITASRSNDDLDIELLL